jgi:hypothetical protein
MRSSAERVRSQPTRTNQRSAPEARFPYVDLEDAEQIPEALWALDTTRTTSEQLSRFMTDRGQGSNIHGKSAAAAMYGFIETAPNLVELTELGAEVLRPDTKVAARQRAFKRIPLFGKLIELFGSDEIPPPLEFDAKLVDLGVAPGQASRARWTFFKAAEQADLLKDGNRLVIPAHVYSVRVSKPITLFPQPMVLPLPAPEESSPNQDYDPLITGLLKRIPRKPPWSAEEREQWLKAAKLNFDLVYGEGS